MLDTTNMSENNSILTDNFGREHTYLRISLTERCNLRCTYCMPKEGIALSPKSEIMTYEEIFSIAKTFVKHGITKIRLTGGEPLVRKDAKIIIEQLATLNVELTITTNAVIVDQFIDHFKKCGVKKINVSLDSLKSEKNNQITRRSYFTRVYNNILLLLKEGFEVKLNCVLIKGFNDDEIIDFIELTKRHPLNLRFIEFMPFDGNQWKLDQLVSLEEILKSVNNHYPTAAVIRLKDQANDTAKNYKIKDYQGSFAVISSVSNPFCDSCNRIRLTANGHLKNCLFSSEESNLLQALRAGKSIDSIIQKTIQSKKKIRSGMNTLEQFKQTDQHNNRSMIAIGG